MEANALERLRAGIVVGLSCVMVVDAWSPMVTLVTMDVVPPEKPVIEFASVKRGIGPRMLDGRLISTDCDDIGVLDIRVASADDMTPNQKLGYSFRVVAGAPPSGFRFPKPYRAMGKWQVGQRSGGGHRS